MRRRSWPEGARRSWIRVELKNSRSVLTVLVTQVEELNCSFQNADRPTDSCQCSRRSLGSRRRFLLHRDLHPKQAADLLQQHGDHLLFVGGLRHTGDKAAPLSDGQIDATFHSIRFNAAKFFRTKPEPSAAQMNHNEFLPHF